MSTALEVHELTVLFGGSSPRPNADGSLSAVLMGSEMPRIPSGFHLGLPSLSFSMNAGECLAVLGVSGSGKSSLLRTVAGLQPTVSGTVRVNGRDVAGLAPEKRGIVYLHQEPVLFPHLDVLENIAFPLTLRGQSVRSASKRVSGLLNQLQIPHLAYARVDQLSGGQRHRVALARALCAEPTVLLLDEPLSSLDPAVRHDVRDALLAAREVSGAAMILVTHDLDDAMTVATQISVIDQWRQLTPSMQPSTLLETPPSADVARVLGVYSELHGVVGGSRSAPTFRWCGGEIAAPATPLGRTALFVRSHEVQVSRAGRGNVPDLTVTARQERAHDVLLTLRGERGEQTAVRVASGTTATLGDVVQLSFTTARFFALD